MKLGRGKTLAATGPKGGFETLTGLLPQITSIGMTHSFLEKLQSWKASEDLRWGREDLAAQLAVPLPSLTTQPEDGGDTPAEELNTCRQRRSASCPNLPVQLFLITPPPLSNTGQRAAQVI